jgi:RNA recognition motif-containing protein
MGNDEAKLFVAGLPDSISEEVLKQLFEATGGKVISVSLPKDRATGRPRGFGFVTLSTPSEAQAARDALDGSFQQGRSISVRPFQAEPPKRDGTGGPMSGPRSGGPGGPRGGQQNAPDRTLYVGNLPYDCTQQEVEELINGVAGGPGSVVRVHLPTDPDGRRRGFGFVTLSSAEVCKTALEGLKNAEMRNRRLVVNLAQPKGERPPPREGGGDFHGGGRSFGPPPSFGGPPPPMGRKTFDDRRRKKFDGDGGGEGGGGRGRRNRHDRDDDFSKDDWSRDDE